MSAKCPTCTKAQAGLDPKTPVWCCLCSRWQMLSEVLFGDFVTARYWHLACVRCQRGAFCRDMWRRPGAERCARDGHIEAFDAHVATQLRRQKDPRR